MTFKIPVMALAITFAISAAAFGGMTTHTASVALSPTDFFGVAPLPAIPKFNGPGTLTKVSVELEAVLEGDGTVTNPPGGTAQIVNDYSISATVTLSGPTSLSISATPLLDIVGGTGLSSPQILLGGQSISDATPVGGISDTSMEMTPSPDFNLADFTGLGTVGFSVDAIGAVSFGGSSNLVIDFNTDASAIVSVTYTFDDAPPVDVPEPMTAGLIGLGGLALVRRRR